MGQRNSRTVVSTISIIMSAMILFALSVTVWGQQVTGAIVGTVTDQSDAPIVGAKVVVTDQDRGFTYNSLTNSEGAYNFPRMPIGKYTVRIEQQGFQAASQKDVVIEINKTARIDVKLQVGQITQVTEISSDAPILQTESTQLSTVIDSRTNIALPLATRNYVQLTMLAPGATNPSPQSMTDGRTTGASGRPYINGNREQANNFLLDGINNNQVSDNLVGYAPSQEAIQEFNLITSNAPAEFGSFQGGIVSVSIKSGTNQYHGSGFNFIRNSALNANSWGNNLTGTAKPDMKWYLFGGTIGGPIIKDKLFFFADYQGTRNYTPADGVFRVFTDAQRNGDFSNLLAATNPKDRTYLRDPQKSGTCDATDQTACFPNNQIPLNRFSPVARSLFDSKYYPKAANGIVRIQSDNKVIGDQGDIKIDYQISDRDRLFGRYSQSKQFAPGVNSFPLSGANTFWETPTSSSVINWTRTLTPAIVNEFRVGVNYTKLHNGGSTTGLGNVAEELGVKNGNAFGPGFFGIRLDSAAVVDNFGNENSGGAQQMFANTVIQFEDSVIITAGKNIVRSGFQFQRVRMNQFYAGNNGRSGFMEFTKKYTQSRLGDFVLGYPTSLGRGLDTGTWGQRSNIIAAYLQNDWRASNSLTLNLGLRYETNTPWVEVNDRMINVEPFTGKILCAKDTVMPDGSTCKAASNRALYNSTNWKLGNFQPRVGFAWTPSGLSGKTVIRGGYTISSYLEGTGTNLRLTMNPPINKEIFANYTDVTGIKPPSTLADGFTTLSKTGFADATIRLWDPNYRPALVQQWNLTIQQQLSNTMTLQMGYVGQRGSHLLVPMPYNQKRLTGRKNPDGTPEVVSSNYTGGNPLLANIGDISGSESNGNSKYHALQTQLSKRFGNGLQFNVAHTYSKIMTDSSGYFGSWGATQTRPSDPYWQNLYDRKGNWGPAYYDVTHMLTSYAIYELPVGKGKRFGGGLPKVANAILGNWQLAPMVQIRGGFATTVPADDKSGTKSRGPRANCVGSSTVFGKKALGNTGIQWFDPSGTTQPTEGFGTCGVGTIRGPGMTNIDLGLQKRFTFSESKHIEFRSDFMNFTNTPILNSPSMGEGDNQGLINGSQPGRNIQLALKFVF